MTETAAELNAKRGAPGRKKQNKRKIASDDEESNKETPQDKMIEESSEDSKDDLEDNENDEFANNKMSIEELEARMKEIEAKIQGKTKPKPGEKKRDMKRKEKGSKMYSVK